MNALGMHIFAGGFTIGVREHFNVLAHLERSNFAVESWKGYCPEIPVHIDGEARWDTKPYEGVDFLYGNPPCSIWSLAANGVRAATEPLKEWTRDVVRVGRDVGAKVVAVESVRGAVGKGADMYRGLAREFGYGAMQFFLVNCYDHGLPQWRPRVFAMFYPDAGFEPRWEPARPPKISEVIADDGLGFVTNDEPIELSSVFVNKPVFRHPQFMDLIAQMEPGERLDTTAERVGVLVEETRAVAWKTKIPLKPKDDGVVPVVYGLAKVIHPDPTQPRFLTLRELARLTGYPDDFTFAGRQPEALRILGKTVCPPVGAWLAGEVEQWLTGHRERSDVELFDASSKAPAGKGRSAPLPKKGPRVPGAKQAEMFEKTDEEIERTIPTAEGGLKPPKAKRSVAVPVSAEPVEGDAGLYKGPTALARHLIDLGYADDRIIATTQLAFGPASDRPLLFVPRDLQRLRARIRKAKETTACSPATVVSSSS
jgi:DNA (cytosine-5)-methyltransferase 1